MGEIWCLLRVPVSTAERFSGNYWDTQLRVHRSSPDYFFYVNIATEGNVGLWYLGQQYFILGKFGTEPIKDNHSSSPQSPTYTLNIFFSIWQHVYCTLALFTVTMLKCSKKKKVAYWFMYILTTFLHAITVIVPWYNRYRCIFAWRIWSPRQS